MVWCSGWRLTSAVSNAGGLGLIGAGSMHPDVLREHIRKCQAATDKPFGVNVPLMYPEIDALMTILVEEGVKIVFTSAGNPKTWTGFLKGHGIKVAHVVSSSKFAVKCEQAGVDAIASSTLTYVACNLRFLGCLRFIADRISSGTLPGRINEVNIYCGSSLPSWRPGTDYRKSYSAIPELGGGVHLDLIHEIDYACALFGMPAESRGICRSVSSLGIRAIDFANYNLIYPEFCVSITLNYYRPTYKRTMEIVFDNDIWTADLALNTVTDCHGNVVFSSPLRIADTYTDQMDHFIKLVESGAKTSANDIRRANDILKIASSYERSI